MRRVFRLVLYLCVLAGLAFLGFSLFADLSPAQHQVTLPVDVDVD